MKKQIVIVLAFIIALAITLGAVMIIGLNRSNGDLPETVKPSVNITPTTQDDNDAETSPPPPYEGKVFRILCGEESSLDFGDGTVTDSYVSRMAYERNKMISFSLGVTISFDYTANVYQTYTDLLRSGIARYDLLSVNMASDGSKFLINGGLDNVRASSLDLTASVFDKAFLDAFTYNGACGFLLGEANPSRILSANALLVSKGNTSADSLFSLAKSGDLTFDALIETLLQTQTTLDVNAGGFHAALSVKGIFSFSDSGDGNVDVESYSARYAALLPHIKSGAITEAKQSHSAVFIDSLSAHENFEYYYVFPMPKYSSQDSYASTVDMSTLFAYAVPSLLSDRGKTYAVIDQIYNCSEGFTEALAKELSLGEADLWIENISYCLYDVFGWGDFSDHAWKAFSTAQSAEDFSSSLSAPARAAKQALLILAERLGTHYRLGVKPE